MEIAFIRRNQRMKRSLLACAALSLASIAMPPTPAFADNAVRLKILVITTGNLAEDLEFAYIKPVLDQIGVPYDVLNAATQDLKAAMLASSSAGSACKAEDP